MATSLGVQAQKYLTNAFITTGILGTLGNFFLNPLSTATKNFAVLGADFTISLLFNRKFGWKSPPFSYIALHALGAAYFSNRLVEGIKADPLNPQAFCDLTSVICHAGSIFMRCAANIHQNKGKQ